MRRILELLLSPLQKSSLKVLYWDIDRRGLNALISLYTTVARQYRLGVTKPEMYVSPKYEWREVDRLPGGNAAHEFVEGSAHPSNRFH